MENSQTHSENTSTTSTGKARRPLATRQAGWAKAVASWLCKQSITPNQISVLSIVFAAIAGLSLSFIDEVTSGTLRVLLLLIAIAGIQLRLACNLFDGMVAVEGGKSSPVGDLYNDIPDRIGDIFIFLGVIYAMPNHFMESVGWLVTLLAVLTAYVRTLATSVGAPTSFIGPMAKQHRMAALTIGCFLSIFESVFNGTYYVLQITLVIIGTGCVVTLYRRTAQAYRFLETSKKD